MAGKVRVNGTNYSITGGKCRVNGTNYAIKKGRALVGGTGYDIAFKPRYTISVNVLEGNSGGAVADIFLNDKRQDSLYVTGNGGNELVWTGTAEEGDELRVNFTLMMINNYTSGAFTDVLETDNSFVGIVAGNGTVYLDAY